MIAYFDTSSWNHLIAESDSEDLISLFKRGGHRVFTSVISASEILRTDEVQKRQELFSAMRVLHGDGPLLERAYKELAQAAAEAALKGNDNFVIPESDQGAYLRSCILDASLPPPADKIWCWLNNMKRNMEEFVSQIKPPLPDLITRYVTREVMESDNSLKLLRALPAAKDLHLSAPQMRKIYQNSDLWQALAGTLLCAIQLSVSHAPKNKEWKKRPGGQDLWQLPYLGIVDVFVTGDTRMKTAADEISAQMRQPRKVFCSKEFFRRLRAGFQQAQGQ